MPLHVVLLAGGPGGSLAHDIRQQSHCESGSAPRPDTTLQKRLQLIRGGHEHEYVPLAPALHVCGLGVLESWLTALQFSPRVLPGCVHVVCNEPELHEVEQLLNSMAFDAGRRPSLISNGCSDPARAWQGEAADLLLAAAALSQQAAQTTAQNTGGDDGGSFSLLAISCSRLLLPEHNLARVIEHALLRRADVCCYSRLTETALRLDAGAVGSRSRDDAAASASTTSAAAAATYVMVVPAEDVATPPIAGMQVVPAGSCQPGDLVAEPLLLLQPATVTLLLLLLHEQEGITVPPGMCLAGLACLLSSSSHQQSSMTGRNRIFGTEAPGGRTRVDSLMWLEHMDTACFRAYQTLNTALHRERAAVANTAGRAGRGAFAVQQQQQQQQPAARSAYSSGTAGSGSLLSTSGKAAMAAARRVDAGRITAELFFQQQAAVNAEGTQQPFYKLPATFFTSQSARDAATGLGLIKGGVAGELAGGKSR